MTSTWFLLPSRTALFLLLTAKTRFSCTMRCGRCSFPPQPRFGVFRFLPNLLLHPQSSDVDLPPSLSLFPSLPLPPSRHPSLLPSLSPTLPLSPSFPSSLSIPLLIIRRCLNRLLLHQNPCLTFPRVGSKHLAVGKKPRCKQNFRKKPSGSNKNASMEGSLPCRQQTAVFKSSL